MRESQLKIPTTDGKIIYGTINRPAKETGRLVIMVHGLTSDMSTHPFPMATMALVKAGYTVVRYNQYSGNKKGRNILDCTTATFCKDLTTVIKHVKKPKQKIFLIGHSWGGLQIIKVNSSYAAAASLWDPSYASDEWTPPPGANEIISNDRILLHWGTVNVISKKLNNDLRSTSRVTCDTWAKAVKFPIQVIQAGNSVLAKRGSYHTKAKTKTDYQVLKATHCFEELPEVPKLLTHTINWFNRF